MTTVIPVKFAYAARDLWFDPQESGAQEGDHVICSTERGTEIGLAVGEPHEVDDQELKRIIGKSALKPVIRIAGEQDLDRAEMLAEKGDEAMPVFRRLVSQSELDMKPVGVEYLFGGEKAVCYFAADERVDFRQLVRELSRELHERIDMRQIGVREEAANMDWHVEEIEVQRLKHPIKTVLKYWKPIGCILEGSSNLLPSRRAFSHLPIVHIDPDDKTFGDGSVFAVENDDSAIADLAQRELSRTDCTNFAFVGWSRRVRWSRRREDRFKTILSDMGHPCHTLEDPWTFGNKSDFVTRLKPFVESLPKPCGIFAANDDIAAVILDVCRDLGISVPGDVVVVGVDDDLAVCDNLHPTLSSVRPDFRGAGRLAVKLLAKCMRGRCAAPERIEYTPLGVTSRLSTRHLAVVGKCIADALDLIRREACSGLKAADVVKAMGVTERLAETRFKSAVGHRITEEIANVRLEHALELLRDPKQGITPIANLCGWDSDAYLKRLFKKRFGMTRCFPYSASRFR